jgi:Xaa-Pro dipeptidase
MDRTLAALYPAHHAAVRARYDAALAATGYDSVLIAGGAQHFKFLDDYPYAFQVNPHLAWWAPVLDNPNCHIIYRAGGTPVLVYYRPADYWHKPADEPRDAWARHFDVRLIADPEDAAAHLPERLERCAFIGEPAALPPDAGLAHVNPTALLDHLHFHRAWKTPYEVECMRRATVLGVRAHRAAEAAFRAGASEFGINLEYLRAAGLTANELPYSNIVALNENGAVLHYQHLAREAPAERRSFLIDAGACFNGYACDITRTYSARRDEFQALVEAMDAAQLRLCASIRPGMDYKDLQRRTHLEVGRVLGESGLARGAPEALYEQRVTHAFFPHGVGHLIGLQTHDVGGFMAGPAGDTIAKPEDQPFLRLTRVVEEGMAFTVEPGLYFIDMLLAGLKSGAAAKSVDWARVDALRPFGGVRIEDDVVVTADGIENLTRNEFARQRG